MSCVWMLQRGHSGDGCVLASTLCKYDLRKGDFCSELGNGATSESGKSLFRAASVTCSLLMLVEDAIGDHTEETYFRVGLITAL